MTPGIYRHRDPLIKYDLKVLKVFAVTKSGYKIKGELIDKQTGQVVRLFDDSMFITLVSNENLWRRVSEPSETPALN